MQNLNPYEPPVAPPPERRAQASPRFFVSFVPAAIAVGLAIIAWVALVSILDRIVAHRFSMPLWSSTLFLASSLSVFAIARAWRDRIHPLAFAGGFSIFSVVFIVAEGDTSNGTDYWQGTIVFGTLLILPMAMYLLARYVGPNRNPNDRSHNRG